MLAHGSSETTYRDDYMRISSAVQDHPEATARQWRLGEQVENDHIEKFYGVEIFIVVAFCATVAIDVLAGTTYAKPRTVFGPRSSLLLQLATAVMGPGDDP